VVDERPQLAELDEDLVRITGHGLTVVDLRIGLNGRRAQFGILVPLHFGLSDPPPQRRTRHAETIRHAADRTATLAGAFTGLEYETYGAAVQLIGISRWGSHRPILSTGSSLDQPEAARGAGPSNRA
jgi:hypothetical protein